MYRPQVAPWWKAAGFGVLAFDREMYFTCSAALETPLQGGESSGFSCLSSAPVSSGAGQTESAEEVADL